jgi:ATP-binding cassette, subfamily C (CFTR/MRP), member 4
VEQEPFIFSGSIKDNILLGKVYDKDLFWKAVEVSQLSHDMEKFQKAEETVIGERGINISGGQKARISLARAIYSEADIYLLDDPLSAVDPQVASDIFQKCIKDTLKDKLVVLATHQLQFLKTCENILLIKDGK